ncbi:hypothetical protein [Zhongshania sp.]|uniref:hypothetical protein n=1 Tax=Zhongshania sp. TaxID=1971902 RepID=UPI0035614EDC
MKSPALVVIAVLLSLFSTTLFADCATRAVMNAPHIPTDRNLSKTELLALENQVVEFVDRANALLPVCARYSTALNYDRAMDKLELVANDYNAAIRSYKQSFVATN